MSLFMIKESIATELRRRINEVGTNQKRVALEAGLNETYVRDILKGKSLNPGHDRLKAIFAALERLGSRGGELPVDATLSLPARRFKAARWACWADDKERACSEGWLNISIPQLNAIEAGYAEPDPTVLLRFIATTNIPMWWFTEGKWDSMPGVIGGRIAWFDRELAPDYPAVAHQG